MIPRTAPWASERARRRLIAVERGLPDDALAALDAARAAVREHERRVAEEGLLLYAGGNVPLESAAASHHPLLSGQPSMGYPGDKYQAGLEPLDVLEVTVARLVADVMGAEFAELRPPSATVANLAVYSACAAPGETIAVLPAWAGGHLSHHAVGAPGIRGLRVVELPYDLEELDVDLDRVDGLLAAERPPLVVVGASLMLQPHRLGALVEIAHEHGARVLYDASHVAGLVAEGRFQAPLREGADVVTFSTYKSFGGPAGGAIVTNDAALMEEVSRAVYPGLTANYDVGRLLPLGDAALFHRESGGSYAARCIATAQALAEALAAEGLAVVRGRGGYTSSHHVAVDVREIGGGPAAARALAEANILLSEIGLPGPDRDPAGGIRIGTQTIVRQGLDAGDAPAVARVVAAGLRAERPAEALRREVAAIRRR